MDHFANNKSPSRERREAAFAKDDGGSGSETEKQQKHSAEQPEDAINASRELTSRHAGEIAPDKELLLSSEELWLSLISCSDFNDEVGLTIRKLAERDGLTLETAGKDPERRRAIVSEMLQDPEIELALIQRIEERMIRHASFEQSLQREQYYTTDEIDQSNTKLPKRESILEALLRKNDQLTINDPDATVEQWLFHATDNTASTEDLSELNVIFGTSFTAKTRPTIKDQQKLIKIAAGILATKSKHDEQDRNIYARNLPEDADEQTLARAREGFHNLHITLDTALRQDLHTKVREIAQNTEQALKDETNTLIRESYLAFIETYTGEDPFGAFEKAFFAEHGVHIEEILATERAALSSCYRAKPDLLEQIATASLDELVERYSLPSKEEALNMQRDAKIDLEKMRGHELQGFDDPDFTRKAAEILADLAPALESTAVERAKELRTQSEILREAHAPVIQKAIEMLSDKETSERAQQVLGSEFVNTLIDAHDAFTEEELILVDQNEVTRIVQIAEMIVNDEIRRMAPLTSAVQEKDLPAAEEPERERESLLARLDAIHEPLLKNLNKYQVCKLFDITSEVENIANLTNTILKHYLPNASTESSITQEKLRDARGNTKKLEQLAAFLDNPPQVRYFEDSNTNKKGYSEFNTNPDAPRISIHINTVGSDGKKRSQAELDDTYQHEMGHAIVDMVTEEIGLIHSREKFVALRTAITASEDGQRILTEASEVLGFDDERKKNLIRFALKRKGIDPDKALKYEREEAEKFYEDKLIEELLCTLMSINDKRKRIEAQGKTYDPEHDSKLSAPIRKLWSLLKKYNDADEASELAYLRDKLDVPEEQHEMMQMFQGNADDADETTSDDTSDNDDENEGSKIADDDSNEGSARADLERIDWYMSRIRDFLKIPRFAEYSEDVNRVYENVQKKYDRFLYIFQNGRDTDEFRGSIINPEKNKFYRNSVKKFHTDIEKYTGELMQVVRDNRDLQGEPPRKKSLLEIIFSETKWVSLMDLKKMATDAGEDIKRMWERRSQTARNRLGSNIAKFIPDNEIPLLNYLGRLKYEYKRRDEEYEQEEVQVWEKALEQLGPNQLLETLKDIRSVYDKDRMKAVMNILVKFGRIDWDDERVWDALDTVGNFYMPKDLCRYDRFTREEWIKKIIFSAWPTDKDLFNKWNTGNASAFTSKRDEYKSYADIRANTGELQPECARMLKIYTEWKAKPAKTRGPIPDDANPYAYEKLVHYAMTNGKMSMEEKFFYLVQGIDIGLLPLERLNILNTEVLGNFPFIDFFTSQNNTRQEIRTLAEKLREEDSVTSKNRYKPGQKTKVWLQLVVAQDESTRQRAAKVMSRGGDQIDHEDIPMLMSILDLNDLDELLSVQRGAQQRVTKEGLKNGYVGFGNVFQTYAQLAKLSEDPESGVYFTADDAETFGKRMMAYLFFDNLVTGETMDRRPNLSWGKINHETMPSGGSRTPKEFRDPINQVVKKILEDKDIYGEKSITTTNKKKGEGEGEGKEIKTNVLLKDLLGAERGDANVDKTDLMRAAQQIEEEIISTLKSNPKKLAEILSEFAEQNDPIPNEGDRIEGDHIKQIRKFNP